MKLRPHLDLSITEVEDLLTLIEEEELTDSDNYKLIFLKLEDYRQQIDSTK